MSASQPFPQSFALNRRETEMLSLFARDTIVPHAALEAVIARYRVGPKGRPLKVHLHYLRGKLGPRGIRILSVRREGFRLSPESRVALAPYLAALLPAQAAPGDAGATSRAA